MFRIFGSWDTGLYWSYKGGSHVHKVLFDWMIKSDQQDNLARYWQRRNFHVVHIFSHFTQGIRYDVSEKINHYRAKRAN